MAIFDKLKKINTYRVFRSTSILLERFILDRRLPEGKRLDVTSFSHIRGQPQTLCFQVCLHHITQELMMSHVQISRQRGSLNLPIDKPFHIPC